MVCFITYLIKLNEKVKYKCSISNLKANENLQVQAEFNVAII